MSIDEVLAMPSTEITEWGIFLAMKAKEEQEASGAS